MVFAIAGRRIDAPVAARPRFPLRNIDLVRQRVRGLFESRKPAAIVTSAACGADLIVLEQAQLLGIECRVILPFDPARFRVTSVADRPGNWGLLYDRLIPNAKLLTLSSELDETAAYRAVTYRILSEAQALAQDLNQDAMAVMIWDGQSRGNDDLTAAFGDEARQRGMEVLSLSTLG